MSYMSSLLLALVRIEELSSPLVISAPTDNTDWELSQNADFEVTSGSSVQVLGQIYALPVGGHLSAALVELVALFCRRTQP